MRLNLPKLAGHVLAPQLASFAREHPAIRLELTTDDDLTDIVADGFDAGVRPGEHLQGDMVAVRITPELRMAIVGSPLYFAKHPPPQTPHDLSEHVCINYRFAHSGALYRWPFAQNGQPIDVVVDGAHRRRRRPAGVSSAAWRRSGLHFDGPCH